MSANQSKHRSEPRPLDKAAAFQYQPLDEGIDCTRFLRINPARNDQDPISCDLVHIAFGARPSYEALSYRWGGEAFTQSIILNGLPLSVGKNLHDALSYLRNQGSVGLLWVDAICIDQGNVQERNRQVSIMSHIYFRADTVVIWLGSSYSKYEGNMRPLTSRVTPDDIFLDDTLRSSTTSASCGEIHAANLDRQRKMMLALAKDEYWKRVWIIQEIGLARKRRVCFGTTAMYWNDFIMTMTLHQIPSEGPMLLDEQIDTRFKGSHRLKKLLSQHKHALCKDPKDKIYGLVGLAVDGHGFPRIDYDKSRFQIWTDTMEFMNSHQMFEEEKEDDIIEYGRLVKFLLMGVESTPLQEVLRPYTTEGEVAYTANEKQAKIFSIKGLLIGCIQSIGPSAKDVAGKLSEVDEWSFRVQVNYQHDLGSAFAQSNDLLRAILSKTEAELSKLCFNHQSLISWGCRTRQAFGLGKCLTWPTEEKSRLGSSENSSSLDTISGTKETAEILLYQLYTGYCRTSSTPWKMGVASGRAARGDLIFWVQGTKTALLVRPTEFSTFRTSAVSYMDCSAKLRVVGTAMVAEDITDPSIDHTARLDELSQEGWGRRLELKLDAPMVYIILPGA